MRIFIALLSCVIIITSSCKKDEEKAHIRKMVDSVGFATEKYQMDSVIDRIDRKFGPELNQIFVSNNINNSIRWKTSICPHDDYSYASYLYSASLKNIKSEVVILFGVAHKAADYNLEDKIIFDNYKYWQTPYGNVKVSPWRNKLKQILKEEHYITHNTIHGKEHSLESIIPFLKYYNNNVEILPLLIPYMSFEKMTNLANDFSKAFAQIVQKENQEWGKDFAFVISTDAVHYGDKGWGGKNFAKFGVDSTGYKKAVALEHEIMDSSFKGTITPDKAKKFFDYTLSHNDYKKYKWTWCGRYSVPFGMLTSSYLTKELNNKPLKGIPLGYATSIDHPKLSVEDIGMGHTAPANQRHWVGYASAGFY